MNVNFTESLPSNTQFSYFIIITKCQGNKGYENAGNEVVFQMLKETSAVGASWRYVAINNANITNFTRPGKRNI